MVAWNGIQLILARSSAVIEPDDLPWSLPAQRRSPIGADISAQLPTKPSVRLSMKSIAASKVVFYHKPNV
ncbi:unnamed protein product [Toxocara canis]|nr:unnamed protein product [Toxocara canis]